MSSILQTILVLPILKGRAKKEEPAFLGKIMMIHPLAHHQRKMKKSICA